jgi:hypothetical protein
VIERQLREREKGIRIVVTDGSSMKLGQCLLGGVLKVLGQQMAAQGVFGREAQLPVCQDVAGQLALHGLGVGALDRDRERTGGGQEDAADKAHDPCGAAPRCSAVNVIAISSRLWLVSGPCHKPWRRPVVGGFDGVRCPAPTDGGHCNSRGYAPVCCPSPT